MSDVAIKTAWRRGDAALAADAKAFWARHDLVSAGQRDERANQLVAVGYLDGAAVAVTSAELVLLPGLRARFAMGRVSVDPARRRSSLGARMGGHMRQILEAWSLEHPEEDVKGFAGAITAAEFGEKQREPIWHDWGVDIVLAGYLQSGEQLRVGWFRHARV